MGIFGLTTFINKDVPECYEEVILQNQTILVDAHSFCCQVYSSTCHNNIYGGDYNQFYCALKALLSKMVNCKIKPIFVFDGGYAKERWRITFIRMKNRISQLLNLNQNDAIYPVFLREVCLNTVMEYGFRVIRTKNEADSVIAKLSITNNFTVLSMDSDFFIYNVDYIPFDHFGEYVSIKNKTSFFKAYMHRRGSFSRRTGLDLHKAALLPALLGNDYISKNTLKDFYAKLKEHKKRDVSLIKTIIKWLKEETIDSAIKYVLESIKNEKRLAIAELIDTVRQVYYIGNLEMMKEFVYARSFVSTTEIMDSVSLSSDEDLINTGVSNRHLSQHKSILLDKEIFMQPFREGQYPSWFMDVITLRIHAYTPQVEDIYNKETSRVHLKIIAIICKILLSNSPHITYVCVNPQNVARLKFEHILLNEIETPNFINIQQMTSKETESLIINLLNIDQSKCLILKNFPDHWIAYFLGFIYWLKNAKHPIPNTCHFFSFILTFIKHEVVSNILSYNKPGKRTTLHYNHPIDKIISVISVYDCRKFLNHFDNNSTLEKIENNPKQFSISVVDSFAQIQNCALAVKHLNCLLNYPYRDYNMGHFFNGSDAYIFYKKCERRPIPLKHIEQCLEPNSTVLALIHYIVSSLQEELNSLPLPSVKIRKRKKNKKEKVIPSDESNSSESDSEYCDISNKFMFLSTNKC